MSGSEVPSILAAAAATATATLTIAIVAEIRQWRSQRYLWQTDQVLAALVALLSASWGGRHNDLYAARLSGEAHVEIMGILESKRESGQHALTQLWLLAPRDIIEAAQQVRNVENDIYTALKAESVPTEDDWRILKREQNDARTRLVHSARTYLGVPPAPSLGIRRKRYDFL